MVLGRLDLHSNRPMRLSLNFTLAELTHTNHRRFIAENSNPPSEVIAVLRDTAAMLQVIRDRFGPTIVTSGWRCPALNDAIGSTSRSQHIAGGAADFYCLNERLSTVWSWIWKDSSIAFGQLILEGSVPGAENASWIHISVGEPYRKPEKCRQVLVYDGSRYSRVDTSEVEVV